MTLDLISLGRAAVDLYSEQLGAPLEEARTFAKYVGGCAANIAIGTSRLGLKSAMLTKVGDEHLGRFVRRQLAAEGVDVSHVGTAPEHLTGLVLLGIRDAHTLPLVFYRENCADMTLTAGDVDPAFIATARALLITGTHLSQPSVEAASRRAVELAKRSGAKVVLDIDYRPVLWKLAGLACGESRYVPDPEVSARLQSIVTSCDLVVGTEEEIHIAGGTEDTLAALRTLRRLTTGLIVMKRGARGAVAYAGAIPERIEDGAMAPGFAVEVMNVLGAGDAFLSGFLRGWLRGEDLGRSLTYANACGALVVARHGCSPAMPTWPELQEFMARGHELRRPDSDQRLRELHRVTAPRPSWPELCVLAIDNRLFLEELAHGIGAPLARLRGLKTLLTRAFEAVARDDGLPPLGVLLDDLYGAEGLARLSGTGVWIGRPIEQHGPGATLELRGGPDVGLTLRSWPPDHVIKCLVRVDGPVDGQARARQLDRLELLHDAARRTDHELLLEILWRSDSRRPPDVVAEAMAHMYGRGIRPDWWKLEPPSDREQWSGLARLIEANDPSCRGILVLGGGLAEQELAERFRLASGFPICKGFAVGRTIFAEPSAAWLRGELDGEDLLRAVAERFRRLIGHWTARGS